MKRILFVLTTLLSIAFSSFSYAGGAPKTRKLYVMAVGVGNYQNPQVPTLEKPISDADSLTAVFKNSNVEVLTIKNEEATGDNIRSKMREFFSKAGKSDNVLFFFSGHGIPSGFCAYDFGMTVGGCLLYSDIKKIFQSIQAYGRMIIADACYSGELRTKQNLNTNTQTKIKEEKPSVLIDTTATVTTNKNSTKKQQQVMLFLSSRNNEVSYESSSMPNGYFTYYLCKALKGEADKNKNGAITAMELCDYVSLNVKESSFDRQHPVMWGNFNKGWIISRIPVNTPQTQFPTDLPR